MLTFLFFIGCTFVEFLHPEYRNGKENWDDENKKPPN